MDDPVEHDDIEEVVEPADPNPESKEMAKVIVPMLCTLFNKPRTNTLFLPGLNFFLLQHNVYIPPTISYV